MDTIIKIYSLIGALICHQLPSRTISVDGLLLPVCARDAGIYIGAFVAIIYIILLNRLPSDKPPQLGFTLALCAFMSPMILDALSSYTGIRSTTNTIRLVTGVFFGSAIPFFLIPAANFKINGRNENNILHKWVEIPVMTALNTLVCLLILQIKLIPWIILSTVILSSLIFIIWRIIYTIIIRTKLRLSKYKFVLITGATIGVLCIMFLISSFILQPLKNLLIQ